MMVVPADLVLRQLGPGWARTNHAHTTERRSERMALPSKVAVTHQTREDIQCCADKTISRSVGRQLFEAAIHLASGQQLLRFRFEDVDPSADTGKTLRPVLISARNIPAQTLLNRVSQQPRDQIGNLCQIFLDERIEGSLDTRQIGCIQH